MEKQAPQLVDAEGNPITRTERLATCIVRRESNLRGILGYAAAAVAAFALVLTNLDTIRAKWLSLSGHAEQGAVTLDVASALRELGLNEKLD